MGNNLRCQLADLDWDVLGINAFLKIPSTVFMGTLSSVDSSSNKNNHNELCGLPRINKTLFLETYVAVDVFKWVFFHPESTTKMNFHYWNSIVCGWCQKT